MKQEDVWNAIAASWKERREEPMKEVAEFLEGKKGNLLDLFCGTGRHFPVHWEGMVYGADFSEEMLKYAKVKAQETGINFSLQKMENERIDAKDNFFDIAIFISGLHCVETAEKRKLIIKELFRVMKPRAKALISVWSKNQSRLKNKPKESEIPWTISRKKYSRYNYIFDIEELKSLLKSAGFKIVKAWENANIFVIAQKP